MLQTWCEGAGSPGLPTLALPSSPPPPPNTRTQQRVVGSACFLGFPGSRGAFSNSPRTPWPSYGVRVSVLNLRRAFVLTMHSRPHFIDVESRQVTCSRSESQAKGEPGF